MAARLLEIEGVVQKSKEGVIHIMAARVADRTHELQRLSDMHTPTIALTRADEFVHPQHPRVAHPRQVRVIPKSRDFH